MDFLINLLLILFLLSVVFRHLFGTVQKFKEVFLYDKSDGFFGSFH